MQSQWWGPVCVVKCLSSGFMSQWNSFQGSIPTCGFSMSNVVAPTKRGVKQLGKKQNEATFLPESDSPSPPSPPTEEEEGGGDGGGGGGGSEGISPHPIALLSAFFSHGSRSQHALSLLPIRAPSLLLLHPSHPPPASHNLRKLIRLRKDRFEGWGN
uniref:Uncharacterized protein n=1 Tax=Mesocestoides corti TaxID=53468 RepID=A0A5K3FZY3_MESCO